MPDAHESELPTPHLPPHRDGAHEWEPTTTPQPKGAISVFALTQAYSPFIGGAERQLQSLSRVLPALGVRTTVVTRRLAGPGYAPRSVVDGAEVIRLRLFGGPALRSLSYTAGALWVLWRRRREVRILHAYELLSPTTTAMLAKLLLRRPVVVKVLAGGPRGDVPHLLTKPFGRVRLALMRRLVDRFVCVSAEITIQLRLVGVSDAKLARIPNGVDTGRFHPLGAAERASLRQRLGLPDGPLAIYAGRLAPEKGLRRLADAWARLLPELPDAHLLMLGEGPEGEALAARHLERLHLLGPAEDVAPYLQAADVFVLVSEREGLSNALLEAMACGLACVVGEFGGARGLLEDGQNGLIVPPGDQEALVAALGRALGDGALRARIGTAARQTVEQGYTLLSVAECLRALYDSLL